MKTLKNYQDILKHTTKGKQIVMQNVLKGHLQTSKGWEDFSLTEELREKIADDISEFLGGWEATKIKVYKNLQKENISHWGLKRFFLEVKKDHNDKRKNIFYLDYCTGQDMTVEMQEIRNDLKK